jgi:hypothetical protein
MSSAKITVTNFALENQCEPCSGGGHGGGISKHMAGASITPQHAYIVSSRPPMSMYETQRNRMIQTLNASNLNSIPQLQAKANLTGYHSGFANFQ